MGSVLLIWDRLFGTLYANYDEYPQTGIDDQHFPVERAAGIGPIGRTWLRQFAYPFSRAVRWRPRFLPGQGEGAREI